MSATDELAPVAMMAVLGGVPVDQEHGGGINGARQAVPKA